MTNRVSCIHKNATTLDGNYMNDGVRKVDFVLVYKDEKKEDGTNEDFVEETIRRFYENNCEKEGLELETDRYEQKGEMLMFVKLHVTWQSLCKYAEELHIKTPLWVHDKPLQKNVGQFRGTLKNVSKLKFSGRKSNVFDKKSIINWPFKARHLQRYAVQDKDKFFTDKQRIEIAYEILQNVPNSPTNEGKRGIENLLDEKVYESAYPLHDGEIDVVDNNSTSKSLRRKLNLVWSNWKMITHHQPLFDVRNYFGEKIGFYYAFMDFYTKMLILPSLVGMVVFVAGLITTAINPEINEICITKYRQLTNVTNESDVSHFWMCPICKPPNCSPWEMSNEGCVYYTWAYRMDNIWSFVLSVFVTMWSILFLKFWKRREASLAVKWDVNDVEEVHYATRPEYKKRAPAEHKNPITLKQEPYVPFGQKTLWMVGSILATVLCLLFACACLFTLVFSRIQLYGLLRKIPGPIGQYNVDFTRWVTHGMLFVLVSVMEKVYCHLAHRLTIYECPKTDHDFMNSLLWKIFIFAMLNDIIPIGYAAWMKGQTVRTPLDLESVDELCDGGCMGEVTELVAVLLLMRLVIGNITEIGIPLMKQFWKRFRMHGAVENKPILPQYVNDFHLNEVEYDGVFEDYMEMMVQYAFIVLFIPALPVAPFVCFLNNVAEIRVDAIKMNRTNRRPLPIRVSGIGIWSKFLDILTRLGILFNAALLAFTSDNVPKMYYKYIYNPGVGEIGFTKFTLSYMPVENFDEESRKEMTGKNITECWYPHFRHSDYPFELMAYYWHIIALRLVLFAVYSLAFLIFDWLVHAFVDDVPESVKVKIKRRHYLVMKSLEAEHLAKEANRRQDSARTYKIKTN